DQIEAAELLLRVGIRAILHLAPAPIDANGGPRRRALKGRPTFHDAGLAQRLGVRAPARPVGRLPPLVGAGGKVGLVLVDQDRILHGHPRSVESVCAHQIDAREPGISTGREKKIGRFCGSKPPPRMFLSWPLCGSPPSLLFPSSPERYIGGWLQ